MAYAFKQIEAHDPNNPGLVAPNASVTIFEPGDPAMTPLTLTTLTGQALANPVKVNGLGYGPAFMHATLSQVAWAGGGLTGTFESYEGMRDEAIAAKDAAVTAGATAAEAATQELANRIASGEFNGARGEDGSNVLPTDEAIANAINGASTATKNALNALYALKGQGGGGAGVTFVTLTSAGQSVSIPDGAVAGLALTQDGTGSRTVTWPTGVRWDGGTTPTLSTAPGSTTVFTFVLVPGNGWLGSKTGTYAAPAAPADTTAPSAVTNLTAGTATETTIPLSWTAATDNIAVTGYEYTLNGTTWTSTGSTGTTYTVTGLTASTSYTIQLRAFDAAGNKGAAASVTKSTTASTVPYATAVAADGPVNYLKLDGNVTDSGSKAQTFTATSLTYGTSLGDGTQAGVFNGTASQVVGPAISAAGVMGASTATMEALVKTAAATFGTVINQNNICLLAVNASRQIEATFYPGAVAKKVTTTATLTVGTTYHIAVTYDGANVTVYINGVASGTIAATGTLPTGTSPVNIGMFSNNLYFNGTIDAPALYTTALSAGRVLAHAQAAGLA